MTLWCTSRQDINPSHGACCCAQVNTIDRVAGAQQSLTWQRCQNHPMMEFISEHLGILFEHQSSCIYHHWRFKTVGCIFKKGGSAHWCCGDALNIFFPSKWGEWSPDMLQGATLPELMRSRLSWKGCCAFFFGLRWKWNLFDFLSHFFCALPLLNFRRDIFIWGARYEKIWEGFVFFKTGEFECVPSQDTKIWYQCWQSLCFSGFRAGSSSLPLHSQQASLAGSQLAKCHSLAVVTLVHDLLVLRYPLYCAHPRASKSDLNDRFLGSFQKRQDCILKASQADPLAMLIGLKVRACSNI